MSLIHHPDVGMPVTFKPLKEEGYLYQLPDGTVVRITFRLQRLTRSQLGTFRPDGITELTPVSLGPGLTVFQPIVFEYPEEQLKEGCYTYEVAGRKEPVRVRPSLTRVERTVGPNGAPHYTVFAHWVSDLDQNEVDQAMTWPSTFAKTGGTRKATTSAVERQKQLLEWLFEGKDWFSDKRNEGHPAYVDWKLADQMVRWGGRKPDSLKPEELRFAAKISLNTAYMVRMSGGDLGQLTPGMFESFGDLEVQKKIRSRVKDPSSYEDLLVELYTASWHRRKDREVSLLEKTGYPDVRVSVNSLEYPIYIECKRLKVSSVNQIQGDIKDASNKIKRASRGEDSDAYGAVLLDFASFVGLKRQETNSIPPSVEDVMQKVRQAIKGDKNTHVNSAIVVWDDYGLIDEESEQLLVFRRRAEVFHHDRARRKLTRETLFNGYGIRMLLRQVPDELL